MISIHLDVWSIVLRGYEVPNIIPIDYDEKKKYETNARAKHTILCGITKDFFVKYMHYKSAQEIWEKLENIYQGDDKVK